MDIFNDSTTNPPEETPYTGTLQRRPDGTFLLHDGTYHIPNEGEWVKQWAELNAMWLADPSRFEQLVPPPPPPEPTLEEVKAAKLAEIIAGSNACAALVKSRYSTLEIDSWALQQTQAESVLAGEKLPPDALLAVLAAANGVSVQDFAVRVLHNVATAEALTKWVVATQQGYEVRLKAIMADGVLDDAGKIAAIRALDVVYALPE